jgi:hypothetical protein
MSHTMNIALEIRDERALAAACNRIGARMVQDTTVDLYQSREHGTAVYLNGWTYPAVIDTEKGTCKYDNYSGKWGDARELTKLQAYYGLEKAKLEAYAQGYSVIEDMTEEENPRLQVIVEGW